MDPNENTKSGPGQNDSPGPQVSAGQAEEPGDMNAESPRKCNICGGPNHYGCGCEARQKQAAVQVETENIKTQEQPAAEAPTPAEPTPDEQEIQAFNNMIESVLKRCSKDDVAKILEGSFDMAKDIKTMADGFEGLCACMYDTNNYLKVITSELMTIKTLLTNEAGRNQDAPENKN